MPDMVCPTHNCALTAKKTRYGVRFTCPRSNCTVACWDGSTSTPANLETRMSRQAAHGHFDNLWRSKAMSRGDAYRWLQQQMKLGPDLCHIGMFTIEQCEQVIVACRDMRGAV